MRKKLSLIALLALVFGLWGLYNPAAQAACGDGSENAVDNPATSENENTDDLAGPAGPSNTTLYGADTSAGAVPPSGYAGTTGNTGYIEAGGDNGSVVEGSTTDGSVSGSVSPAGVCINNTNVPG